MHRNNTCCFNGALFVALAKAAQSSHELQGQNHPTRRLNKMYTFKDITGWDCPHNKRDGLWSQSPISERFRCEISPTRSQTTFQLDFTHEREKSHFCLETFTNFCLTFRGSAAPLNGIAKSALAFTPRVLSWAPRCLNRPLLSFFLSFLLWRSCPLVSLRSVCEV